MVLKNDDHTGDFCQDIDAKEGSCSNVLASDWRDQKDLEQDNDSCSLNQIANNEREVLDSGTLKDDRSGSCRAGLASSLGQSVETVDVRSNTGSPQLGYDMEDRRLEVRKGSEFLEISTHRLSASPKDKSHSHSEKAMQSNEVMESDEKCESSLQTSLGEEVDESDVEEEDVKVCDICGDAGREDLLAVCSRCSDGAEHTYCMREMLDKVPEGDWFCEECKLSEELEAQKQEHQKLLGCSEKSKSFGRMGSVNLDLPHKLDSKDSFCERSKMKNVSLSKQLSSKRSGDSIEAGPTAKKQVIESSTGSPTASSPSRAPVLSKDYSIKNLDKTKGKQTSQFSTGTESAGDSSENTRSPPKHMPNNQKGDFVKSNSFGSSNSKANVKVLDEVVQKQKQGGDAKDGSGKFIGKSTSFKGLGRLSVSEPKVKMLSPKCAPVQELKGHKQVRDRSSFERKNSIKLDHTTSVQTSANSSKRLSRADSISTIPASSNRDYKIAHSDGKVTNLSKQALANKAPEAMTSLGEAKRLSSTNIRGSGTSNSTEAKPNHINLKDGSTSNSSRAADGFLVGANGSKAEVHDNQIEKSLENTFGRSRHGVNGALVSGNRRGVSTDSSVLRAKEGMREENRLKAAIEAAMQKKQHIFKKNKLPENLNELSASNTHVGDDVSNQMIDSIPEEVVHARDAGLSNNNLNSCKDTFISSAKQLKVYPADYVISTEEDAVTSVSAVPEPEAVWQGGFEIHRNGNLPDVCGGFQAHLSSFASGKVLEVVRKLPSKIVLNEVARSCAWPFQFKDLSAREDNIALYFFAKDLDSYLRNYKILLEYMMKHDLALRGDINGVELLVYPSNLLAHKSQRWNTLFFMWGVFRGRRVRCQDDTYTALERPEISVSMSNIVPRIKDVSTITEDVSVSGSDTIISRCEAPVLDGLSLQKPVSLSNGDSYEKDSNKNRISLSSPTSKGNLENSPKNSSPVLGAEAFSESGITGLVDQIQLDPKIIDQHQLLTQEVGSGNNIHDSKKSLSNPMLEKHDILSHSSEVLTVAKQEDYIVFPSEQQVLCTVKSDVNEKFENDLKKEDQGLGRIQESRGQVKLNKVEQEEENKDSMWNNDLVQLKWGGSLKREGFVDINVSAEGSMEDLHSLQCSPMRHSEEDLAKPVAEAAPVIPCQKRSWVDKKDTSEDSPQAYIGKKTKESDVLYGCDLRRSPSSFGDRMAAQIQDVSTSSRIEDTSNEVINDKLTSVNSGSAGSAERCFFLVDPQAAESVLSDDHMSPWKVSMLGNENRLPDGSPNLELALGVEKKQSRKGVLPFFAGIVDRKGPDRPPDIATPKEGDEDASASLSLSLAFPFSDKESPASSQRPLTAVEQTLPARREANTSLLFFRGSSGK